MNTHTAEEKGDLFTLKEIELCLIELAYQEKTKNRILSIDRVDINHRDFLKLLKRRHYKVAEE